MSFANKMTAKQEKEITSIVKEFLAFDDLNNLKDFLFELQNQVLLNTPELNYTTKGAEIVTGNFYILYDFLSRLKKYQN